MKTVSIIVQILLFIAFGLAGMAKLMVSYEEMLGMMPWVEDFKPYQIKIIGLLEVMGALGLVLPAVMKKYKFLIPVAAAGLILTMIGAVLTHISRGESVVPQLVLTALLLVVFFVYPSRTSAQ